MPKPKHLSRDHKLYRAIRSYPDFKDADKELLIALHKMIPVRGCRFTVADISVITRYTTETMRKSILKAKKAGLITCEHVQYGQPLNVFGLTEKFKALGGK